MKEKSHKTTKIGGQALLEGVMMRGASSIAIAVRNNKNEVLVETSRLKPKSKLRKIPILRGVLAFVDSLIMGTGTIMKSAELIGDEEEQLGKGWMVFSVVIGLVLGIGIFMLLPKLFSDLLSRAFSFEDMRLFRSFIAGVIRLVIFVAYLFLVSQIKDIRRTFMYHGAEHRVISCFERGMDLRVANVQKCSVRHDRCGTTFLFIVIIISILVYAVTDYIFNDLMGVPDKIYINMAIRLALLPLVAGISYEILFGLARLPDNAFVRALKAPGLFMQKLTTKIPDDDMADVALKAFNATLLMEQNPKLEPINHDKYYAAMLKEEIAQLLESVDAEPCEVDWIMAAALNVKRSAIAGLVTVSRNVYKEAIAYAKQRALGAPLSQVLGVVNFYGIDIKVNTCVLSPRFETELLCETVIKDTSNEDKILDLCTGSGCIAIALFEHTGATIIASDISEDALIVARENIDSRQIEVVKSDLFNGLGDKVFDKIVSNPPYIPTGDIATLQREVRDFEPKAALDGGTDGLDFYKRIAKECKPHLKSGGKLYLEIGQGQSKQIVDILTEYGFCDIVLLPDYQGIDRIIVAVNG